MKAGIAIDPWKLSIFDRHLTAAGYAYTNTGKMEDGVLLITVLTENVQALALVVHAANTEAAQTGEQT